MKKLNILFTIGSALVLSACQHQVDNTADEVSRPKISVQVVHVGIGSVADQLELSASSIYLLRNLISSPIPAFITHVNIRLGDHVKKGQVLYELVSKERRALGTGSQVDTTLRNFGIIQVKAPADGIVSTFDKQQPGEYILEGTQLCTIAESSNLAFQVNVPYEFSRIVVPGKKCTITLPDNSKHIATITTALTSMNSIAQTQTLLAKPTETLFLPENLIVKVEVSKTTNKQSQILPKEGVLSDEMMKEFWVMKLINDSTAIKVPVEIGNKNASTIEIRSPKFSDTDRIIISGNYGLPDTALIHVNPSN